MTNPGIFGPATPDKLSGLRSTTGATYGYAPAWDPASSGYVLRQGPRFNPALSAYNLNAANMGKWLNAYARQRAGTRQAKITVIGDSTVFGAVGATPYSTGSMAGQLKTYIDSLAGNSDVGWGFVPFFDSTNSSGDVRVSGSIGGVAATSFAIGGTINIGTSPSSDYIQLDIPTGTVIDTVDVSIGKGFGASTIPVDVDGVAATAITATGSGVGTGTYTVTAGSAHSIKVHTGVGGATWFLGFNARKNVTTGVIVNKVGFSGGNAETVTVNPSGVPAATFFQNNVAGDLVIIKTGINYAEYPTTAGELASYYANSLVPTIQQYQSTASVVLLTPNPVTLSVDSTNPYRYPAIVKTLYKAADAFNIPLLDTSHRWNMNYAGNTTSFTNSVHPDQFGIRDEFAMVSHALIDTLVR